MRLRQLAGSVVALVAALLFATTALANGEPKNQPPFTATGAQYNVAPDWFERYAAAHPYGRNLTKAATALSRIAGEPKNELPFTGVATVGGYSLTAKEQAALNVYANASFANKQRILAGEPPDSARAFPWVAAAGSAVATLGALLAAALFAVSRSRRRRQLVHPIGA
jgi:hypothetical protein